MAVITPGLIDDGAISTAKIADDSVATAKVQNSAITDAKIQNGTIQNQSIADDTIEPVKISKPGYLADSVLTYDYASDSLVWSTTYTYTDAQADARIQAASLFDIGDVIGTGSAGNIPIHDGNDFNVRAVTTSDIGEGTNQYFTDARAISAVEGETTLNLQEGLTIDGDISIGDHYIRNNTALPATGIHIVSPENKVAWAGIQLEEYGDDFADNDDKPFNISNPGVFGVVHGGTEASPTALSDGKRVLNISGNARYGTGATEIDTIAQMIFATNETQTSTNRGGSVRWQIQPNGSTDLKDALKLSGQGTTQLDLDYDPNGSFGKTVISSSSTNGIEIDTQVIVLSNLPTTDPVNAGQLWNDSGTLKISAG